MHHFHIRKASITIVSQNAPKGAERKMSIMRIIKLCKTERNYYYCLFDTIPELKYEKIGIDYVGSATDENGDIIFSEHLGYASYRGAFGGRELSLQMKDGTINKIKDHWFDYGSYKNHGEFIGIGAGTLERLQDYHVYCGMDINKSTFDKMLDDYFSREKLYEYDEIREWCNLQYRWHDVILNGKRLPFMVNKYGVFVHRETKKRIYVRKNCRKFKKQINKIFELCLFKIEYKSDGMLIKIERKMLDVLKESLPYSEEEIKNNCKIS